MEARLASFTATTKAYRASNTMTLTILENHFLTSPSSLIEVHPRSKFTQDRTTCIPHFSPQQPEMMMIRRSRSLNKLYFGSRTSSNYGNSQSSSSSSSQCPYDNCKNNYDSSTNDNRVSTMTKAFTITCLCLVALLGFSQSFFRVNPGGQKCQVV